MLTSANVPASSPHLETDWYRVTSVDDDSPRPTYIATVDPYMVMHFVAGVWRIEECGIALAEAVSPALHPSTIFPNEWKIRLKVNKWVSGNGFLVHPISWTSSKNAPLDLLDIGYDFFTRMSVRNPVWFVDPSTHTVVHSGAKRGGMRYCDACRKCFSANNFVHQHLRKVHAQS